MNEINEHDMTKKMLDVMRGGTQMKVAKPILEEHDMTKKMLDTIRGGRLITEVEEVSGGLDTPVTNDVSNTQQAQPSESEDLNPDELRKLEKAFMDSVSPKVEFKEFKIYRKERNAVFSGVFQDLGGMEWVMSLKDSDGLNISAESLKLDDTAIKTLHSLYGFYKNWSKEWSVKLHTEYKFKE
jgi:hypothetical protein